jgi:phage/plasmid-associated DNA primase
MQTRLYEKYVKRARDNNEYVRSNKVFSAELEKRGYKRKRMNAGMRVEGVGLTDTGL